MKTVAPGLIIVFGIINFILIFPALVVPFIISLDARDAFQRGNPLLVLISLLVLLAMVVRTVLFVGGNCQLSIMFFRDGAANVYVFLQTLIALAVFCSSIMAGAVFRADNAHEFGAFQLARVCTMISHVTMNCWVVFGFLPFVFVAAGYNLDMPR